MGLVDDLNRLSDLHASGQLTDEEFEEAKTRMIRESTGVYPTSGDTAGGLSTSTGYDPTLTPPVFDPGAPAGSTDAGNGAGGAGLGAGVAPGTLPPGSTAPGAGPASSPPPPGTPVAGGALPGAPLPPTTTVRMGGPTTVITTGLGTGAVTIGSLPPTTRLKNRAQGLSVPGAVEPQRSAASTLLRSIGCMTIPILFIALMVATAGVAMFPGLARLTAPILCDPPFDHSYVDITSSSYAPGETSYSWELQCYNDRGTVEAADDVSVMAILFVGTVIVLWIITAIFALLYRVTHRRKHPPASDPPLTPAAPTGSLADLSGGPIINP